MRGKGPLPHVRDWRTQDHPRLCGEKLKFIDEKILRQGSPPPMRGKVGVKGNKCFENRITPAYAGKSWVMLRTLYRSRDHPRLCGEKNDTVNPPERIIGSPPPMRGKANNLLFCYIIPGITPAYAGKSFTLSFTPLQ